MPLLVEFNANASNVSAINLGIDYDPSVLTIEGGANGAFGNDISKTGLSTASWSGVWNVIQYDAHDAEVLISLSSASAFGTSSASVVQTTFHVVSGASPGPYAVNVDPNVA